MELVKFLNETFWGDGGYLLLFAVSILITLFREDIEMRGKRMALYSALCFVLVVYNPILGKLAVEHFMEDQWAYLRIFYLLPIMTVIAYAMSEFYVKTAKRTDPRKRKLLIAGILSVLVVLSGHFYGKNMYLKAENIYKIDSEALEVIRVIEEDKEEGRTRILLPEGEENLIFGLRQYTPDLVIAGYSDKLDEEGGLMEAENNLDYTYVIIGKERTLVDCMEQAGYTYLVSTESHFIYKKG